ncbi:SDR family oxidoreductase [Sphingopyxis sp. FD7]|uniref:SDR family oxidoreductase n=1 Tax=Sphingopyxis sp. FD7 TaxID=1914525 RepID=UPI000DC6266E|nr:SDR family oxidoreductase [Sphingopyxis sp. FD7]BBB14005.1 short chain dehydrogenase [Sphingopyxis sp. FD7]
MTQNKQDQKSIFITGAASGIGRESAKRFLAAGWRVGLSDRNAGLLEALREELHGDALVYEADVRDAGALADALACFCREQGGLDALFNCAGILEMRAFAETDLDRLKDIVDVNLMGVINATHAAIPWLRKGRDPHIVNMSSVSAIYGIPEEAVYSASKFAVRGLTEAWNIELEGAGIWVSDVMVAYVATPMVQNAARRAKSVDILGINVTPAQVADTAFAATTGRKVHWFVTDADAAVASKIDETPWEARRNFVKSITGF